MVTGTHEDVTAGPRRGWIAALVTATVGVAVGWFGPIQILLPAQSALIAVDGGKEGLLALVTGAGAAASMIANPLWGVLSDRLRARTGSRAPVLLIGLGVGVAGLLVLAAAASPPMMVLGWVLTQVGLNGPFAVLAALIADRVPEQRRGLVGSLFGIAQLTGTIVGTALAVALGEGALGYIAIAVAVPLLVLPILITRPGVPDAAAEPLATGAAAAPTRRGLRVDRTFVAAFGLRFLLNLVSALGLLYLYYFLSDRAQIDDPGTWILVLTACYVVVAGIAAGVGGALSDRLRRRRGVAAGAAIVLAVGAVLMAFAVDVPLIVTAVLVLGVGYGLFLAVDVAIVTDALPDPRTRATLLGVANIASTLPQVLAPVIAAPVVTSLGGYPALYAATAVVALLALFVLPFLGRIR
ncbi:MFS transporter [Microbacterium sp. cx-55]|uniref:MFS transporter n=1 Tax=Microbacterium sp. cx-55 TaxID=2875948 RepID=UPI001CC0FB9B|nr:MFS transporter [Microbacterium sp. cx-55]MBZ4486547.1 MFS transporter [Microbacterium sp. cx-55]UGB36485.1 MFS transporter [Microbacterium sp. cx-55]